PEGLLLQPLREQGSAGRRGGAEVPGEGEGAPEHPAGRETAAAATAPKILRKSQPGRHRGWVLGRVPAGKFRGRAVHPELTRSRTGPRGVCRMVRCDCRRDRRGAEGWCHLRELLAQGVGW